MTNDDYAKLLLSLVAWREERSNGVNGMLGVMFLIRNRVRAKWFGGDYIHNITSKNQFSSMTYLGDRGTITYPPINDPEFTQVLQLSDEIYDEVNPRVDTLTNGALYYADMTNPSYQSGGWFDRNIVQNPEHPRVAQIGTTTYFK